MNCDFVCPLLTLLPVGCFQEYIQIESKLSASSVFEGSFQVAIMNYTAVYMMIYPNINNKAHVWENETATE